MVDWFLLATEFNMFFVFVVAFQKEKLERAEKKRKFDEECRLKRIAEEKTKWWQGADLFRTHGNLENDTVNEDTKEGQEQKNALARMSRYNFDYSRWDTWYVAFASLIYILDSFSIFITNSLYDFVSIAGHLRVVDDPATKAEQAELEAAAEAKRNAEFEQNNPEFCNQFKTDMEERHKTNEKKKSNANIYKLKGNQFFKQGDYSGALLQYMESLKQSPYETKTLLNVAQVYIKQKKYDEALEFLTRTLYLNEKQPKALCRKAHVYNELNDIPSAYECVSAAYKLEPTNNEIMIQYDELKSKFEDLEEEKVLLSNLTMNKTEPKESEKDEEFNAARNTAIPSNSSESEISSIVKSVNATTLTSEDSTNKSDNMLLLETLVKTIELEWNHTDASTNMNTLTCDMIKKCIIAAEKDKAMCLYLRVLDMTDGSAVNNNKRTGLQCILDAIVTKGQEKDINVESELMLFALIRFVVCCCREQKSSILYCVEHQFVDWIKDYLTRLIIRVHTNVVATNAEKTIQLVPSCGVSMKRALDTYDTIHACINFLGVTFNQCLKSRIGFINDVSLNNTLKCHMNMLILITSEICRANGTNISASKTLAINEDIMILLKFIQNNILITLQYMKHILFSNEYKKVLQIYASKTMKNQLDLIRNYNEFLLIVAYILYSCAYCYQMHPQDAHLRTVIIDIMEYCIDLYVGYSSMTTGSVVIADQIKELMLKTFTSEDLLGIMVSSYTAPNKDLQFIIERCGDVIKSHSASTITLTPGHNKKQMSVIKSLSLAYSHIPNYECNILAMLMNITIESATSNTTTVTTTTGTTSNATVETQNINKLSIRDRICEHDEQIVTLATNCLQTIPNDAVYFERMANPDLDTNNVIVYTRQLGVLSRLITSNKVTQSILKIAHFTNLCILMTRALKHFFICNNPTALNLIYPDQLDNYKTKKYVLPSNNIKYKLEELGHLIRIFATISPLISKSSSEMKKIQKILIENEVFTSIILYLFPTPRSEIGEFTSNSVIQTPKEFLPVNEKDNTSTIIMTTSSILIGNAARILLNVADLSDFSNIIFNKKYHSVERYICSMATCTDIRVRKNLAIVLAKGCRNPEIKDLVSKLRGIQMMIELQDKF